MKLIRCQLCGADRIGPITERWPNGAPVIWGYHSGAGNHIVVKCHRCTGSFKLGAVQFNGLPSLNETEKKLYLAPNSQPAV